MPFDEVVVLDDSDIVGEDELGSKPLGNVPFGFDSAELPSVDSSHDAASGFGGLDDLGDFDDGLPSFDIPDVAPASSFADLMIPCLLYTSPSPRDLSTSRMPSSA